MISAVKAESIRYRVYAIDPRGVRFTEKFMPTFYGDKQADVIGTRDLTLKESEKLAELLKKELSRSNDVPFCGHSPGYLVEIVKGDNKGGMVTLCGFCSTWAGRSGLFVLDGKESLTYLDTLLPLPDVFRSLKDGGELYKIDSKTPFYELEKK
ncbi:hypothetical protein [Rariglobus hedericola]|uniref:Uncharacterized protein n=1 Tax=Rariglobus hedericola TaxID=2597822 RepID=A0A556QPQ3_9BACT|nr:hypothetical protein [Rariglobus hedericola]TSJ78609.1 hypothetical protein FPL22_04715 [Rariglobus hedericola]